MTATIKSPEVSRLVVQAEKAGQRVANAITQIQKALDDKEDPPCEDREKPYLWRENRQSD